MALVTWKNEERLLLLRGQDGDFSELQEASVQDTNTMQL